MQGIWSLFTVWSADMIWEFNTSLSLFLICINSYQKRSENPSHPRPVEIGLFPCRCLWTSRIIDYPLKISRGLSTHSQKPHSSGGAHPS